MSTRRVVTASEAGGRSSAAVGGLGFVQRDRTLGRLARLEEDCESCRPENLSSQAAPLQPRLRIGPSDDPHERQADRVADSVMRMPAAGAPGFSIETITPLIQPQPVEAEQGRQAERVQRQPLEQEEEEVQAKPLQRQPLKDEEEEIQMKRTPGGQGGLAKGLAGTDGCGGRPLPSSVRAFFEPRFGFNFSAVRVHTGADAAASARSVGAKAYTVGRNVVFGTGRWAPGTDEGCRLIAHELTHVVQQDRSGIGSWSLRPIRTRSRSSAAEGEGRGSTQRNLHRDAPATSGSAPAGIIQRDNGQSGVGSTTSDDEYRLQWPGMLGSPFARPTLAPRLELRIDPEIQAQIAAMRMMREMLNPESIRSSLLRIDFDTLLATQPPPWLTAPARPSPTPPVPRGAGPSSPRAGGGGDVLRAIMRIPSVDAALNRLQTRATDHLRRDWRRLSTGGRALLITQSALITGGALAGVLSSVEGRDFTLGLIQNRDLPIPGVPGLTFQFNATGPNQLIRFDLNVGALLPSSLGFR